MRENCSCVATGGFFLQGLEAPLENEIPLTAAVLQLKFCLRNKPRVSSEMFQHRVDGATNLVHKSELLLELRDGRGVINLTFE